MKLNDSMAAVLPVFHPFRSLLFVISLVICLINSGGIVSAQKVLHLTANGQNIKWYGTPTGGTPLDPATDLVNNQKYYASQTVNGVESSERLEVTATVITVEAPVEGTHLAGGSQIEWNWAPVPGAEGYKWNTVNDFSTAADLGSVTTRNETGLACNTNYTRYVWEYSGTCHSEPVILTASTLPCWPCGTSLNVNHTTTGGVSPVNKSTTYGTVNNISGEPSKCWITSNLGSDHQATSVSDATESSAGWYWQFNRKQGYKHDGSIVTPAWTISAISENAEWLTANDPCNLELGSSWRIPTRTEWFNVDNTGSWTDWNAPWSSGLKLHASGYLFYVNGSIYNRGSYGFYWSNTQDSDAGAWDLLFFNGDCYTFNNGKSSGFSLRCLRDN